MISKICKPLVHVANSGTYCYIGKRRINIVHELPNPPNCVEEIISYS